MTVRDTSLAEFEKIKARLPNDEQRIFAILEECGPLADIMILEKLNQAERAKFPRASKPRTWAINQITGRRNRLVGLGVVIDLGPHRGVWNGRKKTYRIWRVRGDKRLPVGWVPVELPKPAEKPLPRIMTPSIAGSILQSARKKKKIRQPLLFG